MLICMHALEQIVGLEVSSLWSHGDDFDAEGDVRRRSGFLCESSLTYSSDEEKPSSNPSSTRYGHLSSSLWLPPLLYLWHCLSVVGVCDYVCVCKRLQAHGTHLTEGEELVDYFTTRYVLK